MNKYEIANTTREQRERLVAEAEAINLLEAQPLTKENRDLLQTYVDGENELKDLRKLIIDKYKR